MPDVSLTAFHVQSDELPSPDAAPDDAWHALLGVTPDAAPHFIVLAEPFTMNGDSLLAGLDYAYPAAVKVGGLASGGGRFFPHTLVLNGALHREGAVGVALSGNVVIDSVVAQGCRPIGNPMHVTDASQNMIETLDGQPPMECLQGIYEAASPRDQNLMRHNLFMGMAMDPLALSDASDGYLIRNVLGVNQRLRRHRRGRARAGGPARAVPRARRPNVRRGPAALARDLPGRRWRAHRRRSADVLVHRAR